MDALLNLLADEFPELRRARDEAARQKKLLEDLDNAPTVLDKARVMVTNHPDGTRTVHPSAAITVPGLLDEIDRLTAHLPARDDQVAVWLKARRDEYHQTTGREWQALNEALDTYRLHADTGTPLDQHTCEGRCADCASGGTR